jgi:hypothetical protein
VIGLIRFKIKVLMSYFRVVFLADAEDKEEPLKRNCFRRYVYYGLGDELMIVDDREGGYVRTSMPWPFCIPARVYWWIDDKRNG